jgi:hypothetical protein
MKTSSGFCLCSLGLLLFACVLLANARADIWIYELFFRNTGPGVNFPTLRGGYLVVDENAGTFSSIVVVNDPVTSLPYYTTSLLSGTYFELLSEGGELYGVFSGGSGAGGNIAESVSFQSIGKVSRNVRVSSSSSMRVPRTTRGIAILNSKEVYVTTSNSTAAGSPPPRILEYGFAGTSEVRTKFDEGFTRYVNDERMSAEEAVKDAIRRLENRGITPQPSPTPGPSPVPTVSPISMPTPTPPSPIP